MLDWGKQLFDNEPVFFYMTSLLLFIFLRGMLQDYKKTVNDVLEYNKTLGVPI